MKLKTKIVYQRYFVNASASFAIVSTSYDLSFSFIGPCYRFDLNIRSKVRCGGLRPKGRSVRLPMPRRRPSFDLDSLFSVFLRLQRNVSKKNRYFPYNTYHILEVVQVHTSITNLMMILLLLIRKTMVMMLMMMMMMMLMMMMLTMTMIKY